MKFDPELVEQLCGEAHRIMGESEYRPNAPTTVGRVIVAVLGLLTERAHQLVPPDKVEDKQGFSVGAISLTAMYGLLGIVEQ